MRKILVLTCSALCLSLSAQITVTNVTFPVAGDTLRYAYDENPVGFNPATPPGGNQTWDFSGLMKDNTDKVIYGSANTGMHTSDFPEADLVHLSATRETYNNVTPNKFEVLGYAGDDPVFGLDVLVKFAPPYSERKSPLNFFDINQQTNDLSLPFPIAQIPDSLLSGLAITPDSIRLRINTQRLEVVDGWGTCLIPGGSYSVLRMKRTEYENTILDAYIIPLGWIDLTQVPSGNSVLGQFLGTDTTVTYRFYSGIEKEEIAVATMSPDLSSVTRIGFKNNQTTAAPEINAPEEAGIAAFPSPAIDQVRFNCRNLPQGDYTLQIFNVLGELVWEESHPIFGDRSIQVELENFKNGTYIYKFSNKKGQVISAKQFVVLKP